MHISILHASYSNSQMSRHVSGKSVAQDIPVILHFHLVPYQWTKPLYKNCINIRTNNVPQFYLRTLTTIYRISWCRQPPAAVPQSHLGAVYVSIAYAYVVLRPIFSFHVTPRGTHSMGKSDALPCWSYVIPLVIIDYSDNIRKGKQIFL